MERTRASLTDNLEMISEKVQGTVDSAAETVGEALDSVKETFNVRHQVERHPWVAVGGAIFAGFTLGRASAGRASASGYSESGPVGDIAASPNPPPSFEQRRGPGMIRQATVSTGDLLRDLGVMEIIREMVKEILPKFGPKIEQALGLTGDGLRREQGAGLQQSRSGQAARV
jgi:hypothetical protein